MTLPDRQYLYLKLLFNQKPQNAVNQLATLADTGNITFHSGEKNRYIQI